MLPLLALLFLVLPIAELYVLIQVGHAVGADWTVLLLLADALIGAWLVRREGARAWSRLRAAAGAGRVPGREAADGALVLVGGALLVTPGFLTDVLGLLCVLPVTRPLVRRLLLALVARRARARLGAPLGGAVALRRHEGHAVVEGEVARESR